MKKRGLIFALCFCLLTGCNTAPPESSFETETVTSVSESETVETETEGTTPKATEENKAPEKSGDEGKFAFKGVADNLSEDELNEVRGVIDRLKSSEHYFPKEVGQISSMMAYSFGENTHNLLLMKSIGGDYVKLDDENEYVCTEELKEFFEKYGFKMNSDIPENKNESESPNDRLVGLSVECDEPMGNEDYLVVARQIVGKWLDSLKDEEGEYRLESYAFTDDIGEERVFQGDGYVNGGREFVCYVGFDAPEIEDTVFFAAGTYDTFYHYYFGPGVLARFRWEDGVCTLIEYDSAFSLLTADRITNGLYGIGKTQTSYKTFYDFMNDKENVEEWLNKDISSRLCVYRFSHNVMQLTNGMIVFMDVGNSSRPLVDGDYVETDMHKYYYDSEGDAKYSSPVDYIDGSGAVVMKYRNGFSVLFDDYNHDGNPDFAIRINSDEYGSTYDIRCMDCAGTPWEDSMEVYLYDEFDESVRLQVSDSGKILKLDYDDEGNAEYKEVGFTDKSNASREIVSPEPFIDYRMYSQKFFLPEELRAYETGEDEIVCYFWNNTNEPVTAGGEYSIQRKSGNRWETVVSGKEIETKNVEARGYAELIYDASDITDDSLSLYRIKMDVNGKTIYGGFYMGDKAKAELSITAEKYPEGYSEISFAVENKGMSTVYLDSVTVYRGNKPIYEISQNKLEGIKSGDSETVTVSAAEIGEEFTAGKYRVVAKSGDSESSGEIIVMRVPSEELYYFAERVEPKKSRGELSFKLTNNIWNKKTAIIGMASIMVLKDDTWYSTSYICNDFGGIKIPYRKTEELIFTNSDYTLRFLEKNFEELKESEHLSEEDKEKFKDMTYDEYVKEVLGVCTAEKGDLCRAVLNILIDDRYTYTEYVYFEMP